MNFQELFPVLKNYTYLNTAQSGIISKSLLDWRVKHDIEFLNHGSVFRMNQASFLQSVKVDLADFFHADVTNTFLVNSFSAGFNTFLEGLSASHRFLLLENDYPSVNYPVQSRGLVCDYVSIDENLEENILAKLKEFKPTVFVFSIIQYINGIKINLDFIKQLKTSFPDLIIVADGVQYCGTERFNFGQSGIDVLIASGFKWMLGGYGTGFMLLKNEVAEKIYTESLQRARPQENFLSHKSIRTLYFEPGHLDTLAFGSLQQSLLFLNELGADFIESTIKTLAQKAKAAFTDRGLLDQSVVLRKDHSSIFSLNLEPAVIEKIHEAQIICSARGKGTRFAFNFYNTEGELNKLLDVIDHNRS